MSKKRSRRDKLLEVFLFPDIDVPYPVYALNEGGKLVNFKSIIYPSPKSKKKFTRGKQLANRSMQAKIFDAFINVGYFDPLKVIREFPVVIQNSKRLKGQGGMYILLDYYFPELRLAVELDSELHTPEKDKLRDKYLENLGITVKRINGLHKPGVQKKEFRELTKFMRETGTKPLLSFDFQKDTRDWIMQKSDLDLYEP